MSLDRRNHTNRGRAFRLAALAVVVLFACEAPVSVSPSPEPAPSGSPAPTSTPPRTAGYRYAMLYLDFKGDKKPVPVRLQSLNGGPPRFIAMISAFHDAQFAIHPRSDSIAILDKLDHLLEHTTTWRLRLVDLASSEERDVIEERTDPTAVVPWDVGWAPDGRLLLASRPSLDAVDLTSGERTVIQRFPPNTVGVIFRDLSHPGLVVSQTVNTYSVYVIEADRVRHVADRPLVGLTEFARRPGTDEVMELVTRFDGKVTMAILGLETRTEWVLQGPKVEGYVAMAGTTPASAFVLWPVARSDPAALGVLGAGFLYALGYDASMEVVAGVRNWGPFGPLGVSPDGRALIVPAGAQADKESAFSISICCETRPPKKLLDFGYRWVIGWVEER
jgi:hypothetical protein